MTAGWCSRTVRAVVFAAVCVLLAALGHVMMSGSQVARVGAGRRPDRDRCCGLVPGGP